MDGQEQSWVQWLGELAFKTGVKFVLNIAVPGSGSIMDFREASCEFKKGNMMCGLVNVGFGVLDFTTVGLSNILKTAALKKFPSEIVQAVLSKVGKMTWRDALHNLFMSIISSGGHEVGESICQSFLDTLFTRFFEMGSACFKATRTDMILPKAMIPMMKLVEIEVENYIWQHLGLNYCCSVIKGFIKNMTKMTTSDLELLIALDALRPYGP